MDISESPDPQQQSQAQQQITGGEQLFHQHQPTTIEIGMNNETTAFQSISDNNDYDDIMNSRNYNMMFNTITEQQLEINHHQNQQINNELDIDSRLLQQFSCLGTTDHEDLVNDLQKVFNNQLSKETAKFFLEMSNWNLQTAICCYLDYSTFTSIPSMKIVQQTRPSINTQAWKLQNDGDEAWPNGCYLMSPGQMKKLEVPSVKPGETCDIVADIPPESPAIMWRLCTPRGICFGETMWLLPGNTDDTTTELAQRMAQLHTSSSFSSSSSSSAMTPMNEDIPPPPQISITVMKMD